MPNGRKRIAAIAAILTPWSPRLVSVVGAMPTASAKPDLETVKKQVEKLDHQAEQASERYNDARVKLHGRTDQARTRSTPTSTVSSQVVAAMRQQVATMVVDAVPGQRAFRDVAGGAVEQPGRIPRQPQRRLGVQHPARPGDEAVQHRAGPPQAAQGARSRTRPSGSPPSQHKMAAEKAPDRRQGGQGQGAPRRARGQGAAPSSSPAAGPAHFPDVPASGRAAAAVRFAMAQVGKAYAYGAVRARTPTTAPG